MVGIIDPGSIGSTLGRFTYTGVGPPIFDRLGNVIIPPADSELLKNIRTDQYLSHMIYMEERKAMEARTLQLQEAAIAAKEERTQKILEGKKPQTFQKLGLSNKFQSLSDKGFKKMSIKPTGSDEYAKRVSQSKSVPKLQQRSKTKTKSIVPQWTPELAIAGRGAGTEFDRFQGFRERAKMRAAERLLKAREATQLKAVGESTKIKEPVKKRRSTERKV